MSQSFQCIKHIDPKDPKTWEKKLFLTLDIDWAEDIILEYVIDLLESKNVAATWFITHDTPLLKRLRSNPNFELGIHPNFNFLLQGDDSKGKNAEEVIERLMDLVPEAVSVRSHSMTQSSYLQSLFKSKGLIYECNHFIPDHSTIDLKPWFLWNDMIKIPYCWEDDVVTIYGNKDNPVPQTAENKLTVVDFHPIHIFLNTEDMDRYEKTRSYHHNPSELQQYRNNDKRGAYDIFMEVLEKNTCA